ncbi:hypothetical protein NBRC116601_03430 [Cognatishimia sp. WU-CL00825]|uniref:hypothetical protein n=1 Tax=Cognatishimia sp. WU-CL00825 TaxID=3127658 RepID=UPI0031083309
MNVSELIEKATLISESVAEAQGDARLELHEQLHRTLELIKLQGGKVPAGLRRLDLELIDEAVESSFDNMPV